MKNSPVFLSGIYSVAQLTLGLLLHPYQTMQSVVQDKVFVWVAVLPTGFLAITTLIWRLLIVPAVRLIFSCSTHNFLPCDMLPFFANWLTFFCVYWQILLLYLLFRFSMAYRERSI